MQHRTGKKTYQLLGKVLEKKHPELAQELLATYCHIAGQDTDFRNIKHYYQQLCTHMGVIPQEYKGPTWTQEKMNVRRVFISAMIRIYCPGLHKQPTDSLVAPSKFGRNISETMEVDLSNISKLIRQVIVDEKVYEEYRLKVDSIVDHIFSLKQLQNGKN